MDLNDIKAIMTGAGEAMMGVGEAEGPNRAVDAARQAITSPLLENVSIDGAKGLIVNIVGNRRVELSAIKEAMEFISRAASPEAKIKFGQVYDDNLGDKLRITVIATGFPAKRASAFRPAGRLFGGQGRPRPVLGAPQSPGVERTPGVQSSPEDWGKPAFLRWKVRKLR
ncbi:MAG: cell division protein FtsZ, partial [Elusimicrobiota bacterium]